MAASNSNIFGVTNYSISAGVPPFATSATTEAGQLIDKLKYIADVQLLMAMQHTGLAPYSADQGQNKTPEGLIQYENQRPDPLTYTEAMETWPTAPSFPVLPTFPVLPAELLVDFDKIKADARGDLNDLLTSWIVRYLPAVTDVSALNSLIDDTLSGANTAAATAKLNNLETELKNALTSLLGSTKAAMEASIANLNTSLASRTGAIDGKVTSAIDVASNNVDNVAWSRARDNLVAEALREENEVTTLWASRGFTLPPGVLTAQILSSQQKTLNASAIAAADRAVRSQDFYFNIAIKDIDAWMAATQLSINTDLENYKNAMAQRMRATELELTANRDKAKQAFEHLGLTLDFTKFSGDVAYKYRLGANEAVEGLVNAYANLMRNDTEYSVQIAGAQRQALAALVDYYRAAIQGAEVSMKVNFANTENDLKWTQIAADFIARSVGHHVQSAATAASTYAQFAASALSGLNAIASNADIRST